MNNQNDALPGLLTGHDDSLLMTDGAVGSEGDAGTEAKRRFRTVGPRSEVSREKMRLLLFSALLTAAVCLPMGPAAAACDQFTPFGQPVSSNLLEDVGAAAAPNRVVICHTGQVVAFNPERNVSDWVAYRLRREDLQSEPVQSGSRRGGQLTWAVAATRDQRFEAIDLPQMNPLPDRQRTVWRKNTVHPDYHIAIDFRSCYGVLRLANGHHGARGTR